MGSWANTQKLAAKNWRFGLFYWDYVIGIGLALVVGVIVNYIDAPVGNATLLFGGVALIILAILLNANAYRKLLVQQGKVPHLRIKIAAIFLILSSNFSLDSFSRLMRSVINGKEKGVGFSHFFHTITCEAMRSNANRKRPSSS